jgi:hypothetical protein
LIRPDDEDKPFVARWNSLTRALLVEPSVKLIARSAMDYADLYEGTNCFPSTARLARNTGYSEKTVGRAWAAMRGIGMAEQVGRSDPKRHKASEYHLQIPDDWKALPLLGPKEGKFTCLHCGKLFIPKGNCTIYGDRDVRYNVRLYCFCPPPRENKGRADVSCFQAWEKARKRAGSKPWNQLGGDVWKLFRQARGDDW